MILYRSFVPSVAAGLGVLDYIAAELGDGRLGAAAVSPVSQGIVVDRGGAGASVRLSYGQEATGFSIGHGAVSQAALDFVVEVVHPDDVGLCWELLILVHSEFPSSVWLSDETYPVDARNVGGTPVALEPGSAGVLLSANAFDRLTDPGSEGDADEHLS